MQIRAMDFSFPNGFCPQARNNVVTSEIKASRLVNQPGQFSFSSIGVMTQPQTYLVFRYIMTVLGVFAHEACELGRKPDGWSTDKIGRASNHFLRRMAINATLKYDPKEFNLPELVSDAVGSVLPQIQRIFESFPEWKKNEDDLLEIAEHAKHKPISTPVFQTS